jgi:ABC-type transport system involved in multi-copper enzyme maturation permease subunit
MPIPIIIRLTIREALRRKVILGLLVLGAVFLILFSLGVSFAHSQILKLGVGATGRMTIGSVYSFLLTSGLYAANFLIVMLSVLVSVDTISGEISTGTVQAIAVKPIRRSDILLGKWLGLMAMLGVCVLFLAGGVILLTAMITGYTPPNPLSAIVLMFLESIVLLCASLLGGTRLSTLANGVFGFGLFGVALIGGFIEQIGAFLNNDPALTIGHIATIIMPSDALWRLALSQVAEGLNPIRLMSGGFSEPDASIVIYALVFMAVVLLLAMRSFAKRDL